VYAADQLFATLDPTLRRIELPGFGPVVLADTVGFVRNLPHELVAAFRSTLEETLEADVLLHVIDAHDPERQARLEQVNEVLYAIGAQEVPQILVYNKIDLSMEPARRLTDANGRITRLWCSAASGEGIDLLMQALEECSGNIASMFFHVAWTNNLDLAGAVYNSALPGVYWDTLAGHGTVDYYGLVTAEYDVTDTGGVFPPGTLVATLTFEVLHEGSGTAFIGPWFEEGWDGIFGGAADGYPDLTSYFALNYATLMTPEPTTALLLGLGLAGLALRRRLSA